MIKKGILIDSVLIAFLVIALFSLIFTFQAEDKISFSPQPALFEIPSAVEYIFVDDNLQFSTPKIVDLVDGKIVELEKGTTFLTYQILERVMDDYFAILDFVEERIDHIEKKVFSKPGSEEKQIFCSS